MNTQKKTVGTVLMGGLGNQLFQFAAAYAVAKRHGAELILDTSFYNRTMTASEVVRHFQLDAYNLPPHNQVSSFWKDEEPPPRASFWLKRRLNKKLHKLARWRRDRRINLQREKHFYHDDLTLPKQENWFLGYYQSELYFRDVADDIRQILTLKNGLSSIGQENERLIKAQPLSVCLQVRRGDFVSNAATNAFIGTASMDYYRRAIAVMQKMYGPDIHFFAFSDDRDYVREQFGFLENMTFLPGQTIHPYDDIHLMSCCSHYIIANSSFAWWGAWLNPRTDKTVIAPRWWFSRETMQRENIIDIWPEGWLIT
jgi:hypothetical protein